MIQLTHSGKRLGRLARGLALLCCVGTAATVVSAPMRASAQTPVDRVVEGRVENKAGGGIKGATVYLKDGHTLEVKTYVASNDGSYRFGQLAQNTDYQLWATSDNKKSAVKNISSFDTRNDLNINLKIDK